MNDPAQERPLERTARELHALTEVAKTISLPLELPDLIEAIMNKIIGVLEPAEVGAVMLWDQPSGLFRPGAAFGYDLEELSAIGLRAGEGITGKVFEENLPRLLSSPDEVAEAMEDIRPANYAAMVRALGVEKLPRCTIAAPLAVDEQKYGVLLLETIEGPAVFTEADLPFVQTLADLIALAIERIKLSAQADAIREARETERMRSELMATLSHELRMPLTAIRGYATALLLEEVEWSRDKQAEFLRWIDEECQTMEVMLSDILDSSLIDVSQLAIEPLPLDLRALARDLAQEFQQRTQAHHLVVDLPLTFPPVQADPRWIKQVFRNILDNAIKYSPDGGLVVIQGEVRPESVVINIADQGIGISPENLIPLFEKYLRVKSSNEYYVPGTGLGLPIARAIVEAHGGRIWAESKKGQGTTVSFSLPRG